MLRFQQDFFECTVDRMPTAIAVDDHGEQLSYGALEARANQIAHLLRELGSGPNQRICIFTAKNAHAYAAILGTLKSGACWVPLSSAFPKERLNNLVSTLQPCAVLVDTSTLAAAQEIRHETGIDFAIVQLGGQASASESRVYGETDVEGQATVRPTRDGYSPDDLAYIIFTSGSTGTPKGVMVLHRNTTQFLDLCGEFSAIEAGSRFAHFSELTFDPSVFDLFYCWASGGTLVPFNRRSYRINPGLFLREQRINVLFTVPSVIASIRDSGQLGQPELASLKHLLLTGEAFQAKLIRDWYDAYPEAAIYNMYGTTETAIVSHWYKFPRDIGADAAIPVGHVLPGTRVTLLDGDQAAAAGQPGECVVYGAQLSPGYWNNPFQTAAAFVRDPLNSVLPQTVYRTGDVLRRAEDGLYYFVGRVDNQVKVRGHRVELGEVENALIDHTEVWEAAVVAAGHAEGGYDKQLIAFVKAGRGLTDKGLMQFVSERVPNYMVPSKILMLEEDLPRNQNGKVDRMALNLRAAELLNKDG